MGLYALITLAAAVEHVLTALDEADLEQFLDEGYSL